MKQIRNHCFETNSSSVHAICINVTENPVYPECVEFAFDDFGWTHLNYTDMSDRANYLWTALTNTYIVYGGDKELEKELENIKNKIINWFEEDRIKYEFHTPAKDSWELGYVDHSEDLEDFLNWVLECKENLYQYLFTNNSFIETGNDNTEEDYPYEGLNKRYDDDYIVFSK